jgi:hypothetical protein
MLKRTLIYDAECRGLGGDKTVTIWAGTHGRGKPQRVHAPTNLRVLFVSTGRDITGKRMPTCAINCISAAFDPSIVAVKSGSKNFPKEYFGE